MYYQFKNLRIKIFLDGNKYKGSYTLENQPYTYETHLFNKFESALSYVSKCILDFDTINNNILLLSEEKVNLENKNLESYIKL